MKVQSRSGGLAEFYFQLKVDIKVVVYDWPLNMNTHVRVRPKISTIVNGDS